MRADGCTVHDREHLLRWYASSPGAERGFCSRCGSSLAFRSTRWPGELHLAVANLAGPADRAPQAHVFRSEEHTSELQSLMRNSYAVFCLKKKNTITN